MVKVKKPNALYSSHYAHVSMITFAISQTCYCEKGQSCLISWRCSYKGDRSVLRCRQDDPNVGCVMHRLEIQQQISIDHISGFKCHKTLNDSEKNYSQANSISVWKLSVKDQNYFIASNPNHQATYNLVVWMDHLRYSLGWSLVHFKHLLLDTLYNSICRYCLIFHLCFHSKL